VASVTYMGYMFFVATNFNQCLSTWADITPPDVNVYSMFNYSGCLDKDPDPSVSPWCQGDAEQCYAPSNSSASPTSAPSTPPTEVPIAPPTSAPSASPTSAPIASPTSAPIASPTSAPIASPTSAPSTPPTKKQKKTSKKSKK